MASADDFEILRQRPRRPRRHAAHVHRSGGHRCRDRRRAAEDRQPQHPPAGFGGGQRHQFPRRRGFRDHPRDGPSARHGPHLPHGGPGRRRGIDRAYRKRDLCRPRRHRRGHLQPALSGNRQPRGRGPVRRRRGGRTGRRGQGRPRTDPDHGRRGLLVHAARGAGLPISGPASANRRRRCTARSSTSTTNCCRSAPAIGCGWRKPCWKPNQRPRRGSLPPAPKSTKLVAPRHHGNPPSAASPVQWDAPM